MSNQIRKGGRQGGVVTRGEKNRKKGHYESLGIASVAMTEGNKKGKKLSG